jgi:hypothetical protein
MQAKARIVNEQNIQTQIMLALSRAGVKIFRNNVGTGWVGRSRRITKAQTVFVNSGDVVIQNARPLHAGLCEGSADLIGWMPVKISADMVGQTVAVFIAAEVKTESGRTSDAQVRFIDIVNRDGGRAGVARCAADAVAIARPAAPMI